MQYTVKPLVNGRVLALMGILSTVFAILAFGISYWMATSDLGLGSGFTGIRFQGFLLVSAVFFAGAAIVSIWRARFFVRLEWLRQEAARGSTSHTVLAAEQPNSRTAPLTLPMTISRRAKRPLKLIAWPLIVLLVFTLASTGLDHGVWNLRFFAVLLPALVLGSFIAQHFIGERQIAVSDSHLTVRIGGFQETVAWEETRLFAITEGRHGTVTYEVSGAQAWAPWVWVRAGTFSARLFEPTIPQYEYDRQMEALLALVAAKTGLPLFDLR